MAASISIQQSYDGKTWIIRWPDGRRTCTAYGPAWVAAHAWGMKHGGIVYALNLRGQVVKATEYIRPDGEGEGFIRREIEPGLIVV